MIVWWRSLIFFSYSLLINIRNGREASSNLQAHSLGCNCFPWLPTLSNSTNAGCEGEGINSRSLWRDDEISVRTISPFLPLTTRLLVYSSNTIFSFPRDPSGITRSAQTVSEMVQLTKGTKWNRPDLFSFSPTMNPEGTSAGKGCFFFNLKKRRSTLLLLSIHSTLIVSSST